MAGKKNAPLIVFDLDGTLADTAGDLIGALNFILAQEGLPPTPLAEARALLGAGARALIARGLDLNGVAVSTPKLDDMFHAFLAYYESRIAQESRLYPGVVAALDALEARGARFAVCTNKIEHPARLLLRKLDVAERFAFICGQDTFGVAKPDPKPLLETIARAGGLTRNALMVGDSKTDIATAKAAGVPVVAVDFGYSERPVAEYSPDRVISHFDELPAVAAALLAAL